MMVGKGFRKGEGESREKGKGIVCGGKQEICEGFEDGGKRRFVKSGWKGKEEGNKGEDGKGIKGMGDGVRTAEMDKSKVW